MPWVLPEFYGETENFWLLRVAATFGMDPAVVFDQRSPAWQAQMVGFVRAEREIDARRWTDLVKLLTQVLAAGQGR